MKLRDDLLEKAGKLAKAKFLAFAKGIYDIDEETFEHLWQTPINWTDDSIKVIAEALHVSDEDSIDEIRNGVYEELGKSESCFIPLDKIFSYLSDKSYEQYYEKVRNGEIEEDYNAFIVYDEKEYNQFEESYNRSSDETRFIDHMSQILLHEISHLNNSTLMCSKLTPNFKDLVNGGEIQIFEDEEAAIEGVKKLIYRDHNDVLMEVLSLMIDEYKEGDSVEDCLYKVIINSREENTSLLEHIDDRMALSVFVLYPEKMTEWLMFSAYGDSKENFLDQKIIEIYGDNTPEDTKDSNRKKIYSYSAEKLKKYASNQKLTDHQKEMLENIGIRFVDKKDFGEVASSEEVVRSMLDSFYACLEGIEVKKVDTMDPDKADDNMKSD